jgi:hypothetical protein
LSVIVQASYCALTRVSFHLPSLKTFCTFNKVLSV